MSSDSARDRANVEELVAALSRISVLNDTDRNVASEAATTIESLHAEVERLAEQVRWLSGKPFRPSREKVPPGQLALDLLEMLTANGVGSGDASSGDASSGDASADADESPGETANQPERLKKRRKRRGRDLEHKIVESHLDADECKCDACGKDMSVIGFEAQKRFEFQPAKMNIVEERCMKYACKCGDAGVVQAEPVLPAKPIPGSMASASVLAHVLVSKLLDGLPIERIAKRLRRHGVDLSTNTLHDWMARTSAMFATLYVLFREELRACDLISLDDTPMPAKTRDHPKGMQRGRQWIYLGDLDRVAYAEYTPDWKGRHPRRVLDGFSGDIQGDGYAGINPLFSDGADSPRRIGCNDHARRKFVQALEQRDNRAQRVVDLYRALYRVEADARDAGDDAEARLARRRSASAGLWEQLAEEIARLAPNAGKKSPLGKAIIYWQRQRKTLEVFLDDGRVPISNAHVERQVRTVALFRKNSLFYGSPAAGERYSVLLTVLLNCVLADVNPYEYIKDVIDKIANGWPQSRLRELMPANWAAARQADQAEDQPDSHVADALR